MAKLQSPSHPPHPFAKQARLLWFVGLALVAVAILSLWTSHVAQAALFGSLGIYFVYRAARLPGVMRVVQAVNHSLALQLAGQSAEAEALLAATEPLARGRYLRRIFPAHRAQIALDRGDLGEAERQATLALAMRSSLWTRVADRVHLAHVQSLRALARALAGNDAGALEDAAAVEAYDEAGAGTLGRALLARLAVSARAGDRDRLRALCRTGVGLPIVAELRPRERAMFRSYRRLAFAPEAGAYRKAWTPEDAAEASPEAELFRRSDTPDVDESARPPLSPAQQSELERLHQARKDAGVRAQRKVRGRAIGAGVAIGLALLVPIFALMPPARKAPHRARTQTQTHQVAASPSPGPELITGMVVGGLGLLIAGMVLVRRREGRIVIRAHRAHVRADEAALEPLIERLRKSWLGAVRAQGNMFAADRAYAAADFTTALARADEAMLALANPQQRALHADILVPTISTHRAVALAALGRTDEARVEHAALLQACPTFAFRASVAHRVDLLCAVTAGAWEQARAIAAQRPAGAPIPIREEMLGDLARMEEAAADAERRRVGDELAENPALARWIECVAPGLAERVIRPARAS